MNARILTVATQFVDLVLRMKWHEVKELSPHSVQVLFDIVAAAGFELKEVVPGKLITHQFGVVNELCPCKVVCKNGSDNHFATGWLDCAAGYVTHESAGNGEKREQLFKAIVAEIDRSIPFVPIQLTLEGDLLLERPPTPLPFSSLRYFVDHKRDKHRLVAYVGIHNRCGGLMCRRREEVAHDAIVCQKCDYFRVLFPEGIQTCGELRQFFDKEFAQVPA